MKINFKDIKDEVKELEKKDLFVNYKKNNPSIILFNAFSILENNELIWEINYYNPEKRKLISFSQFKKSEEQDILDKKAEIKELDLKKIKVNINEVLKILDNELKKSFPSETITKKIIILQDSWNFTLLTSSFNIIKMDINASTGKIISKKIESILSCELP